MGQITPFLSNTESLLHYSERRLHWVLLITTLLHLAILLTVNINPIMQKLNWLPTPSQLAVTLSPRSETPPDIADFFGIHNATGHHELSTETSPEIKANNNAAKPNSAEEVIALHTNQPSDKAHVQSSTQAPLGNQSLVNRKVISAATFAHEDAAYLYRWQQYIEAIASELYPKDAINQNLTGKLLMMVVLKPDGSLVQATIRRSSGSAILDEAALKIVEKAQPFEAIPKHMLKNNDCIEIIRTWHFRATQSS